MSEKKSVDGQPVPRQKYTPAFEAECVRQVAAGARQSDVARAQGSSPALLGRWQRSALEQAVPNSAERDEIRRLRGWAEGHQVGRYALRSWPRASG